MADIPEGFEAVTPIAEPAKEGIPAGFEAVSPAPAAPKPEPQRSLLGVLPQAVRNIPSSAVEMVKSTAEPFMKPVTVGGLRLDPLTGGMVNIGQSMYELAKALPYAEAPKEMVKETLPSGQTRYVPRLKAESEEAKKAREEKGAAALAVGKHYEDRFGSWQGFLKALETDPVGVTADVASVVQLGSGLGLRVPPSFARVAKAPFKYGTTQAAETYAKALGVGPESLQAARQAGRTGGVELDTFYKSLRNQYTGAEYVDWARKNVDDWYAARRKDYERAMGTINKQETIDPIRTVIEWTQNQKMGRPYGVDLERVTPSIRADIDRVIRRWATEPKLHTLEGLDELKKSIGAIYEKVPHQHTTDSTYVGNVYNSIKKQIVDQAPEYSKIMADYEKASEALREATRTLSLGEGATQDAAFRKLLSTMRNGVNANYGHRLEQLTALENAATEKGLPAALAGQTLSARLPRGLAGYAPLAAAWFDPTAILATAAFSPRMAGYGAAGLGRAERGMSNLAQRVLGSAPGQTIRAAGPYTPFAYEAGQIVGAMPPQE